MYYERVCLEDLSSLEEYNKAYILHNKLAEYGRITLEKNNNKKYNAPF